MQISFVVVDKQCNRYNYKNYTGGKKLCHFKKVRYMLHYQIKHFCRLINTKQSVKFPLYIRKTTYIRIFPLSQ
jgi:hypothetical protein